MHVFWLFSETARERAFASLDRFCASLASCRFIWQQSRLPVADAPQQPSRSWPDKRRVRHRSSRNNANREKTSAARRRCQQKLTAAAAVRGKRGARSFMLCVLCADWATRPTRLGATDGGALNGLASERRRSAKFAGRSIVARATTARLDRSLSLAAAKCERRVLVRRCCRDRGVPSTRSARALANCRRRRRHLARQSAATRGADFVRAAAHQSSSSCPTMTTTRERRAARCSRATVALVDRENEDGGSPNDC